MNIVSYPQPSNIVYCIVDRTDTYTTAWTQELIKNISDFTVSNIWSKQYSVLVGLDEDALLQYATDRGYAYAVVLSTGTEFINGTKFFDAVEELTKKDFFLAGHILDRGQAYYEVHHQCYVVNLKLYESLHRPTVGQQSLGKEHTQSAPTRSIENYHDDYTPIWVNSGAQETVYKHKMHGWNILSTALDRQLNIIVFDTLFRHNKKYYYPENPVEFQKHLSWAYARQLHCANNFVHTSNTETVNGIDKDFECVITPASGTWWTEYISKTKPVTVVYYDYNDQALDYWKENAPDIGNVTYKFIKIDLLGECDYSLLVYQSDKTIINLSNIFCYEGTSMFASLVYKQYKESQLLAHLPKDYYVLFNGRSSLGFNTSADYYGQSLVPVDIAQLIKPTWHMNQDWQ